MATWELQLISRIVRTGDLNTPVQWGVTQDDFLTLEGRGFFNALCGYYAAAETSGAIWGPSYVRHAFPNFALCDDPTMTTDALCVEVRKQRLNINLKTLTQQALELVDNDPVAAINRLQTGTRDLLNIGMSQQTDVHFHDAFSRNIRRMELIKQGVDLSCGRWLWSPLQEATGGIQPDDYVVIFGRPKNFKCIPVDEPILSWDGTFTTIERLRESVTLDHETQQWARGVAVQHTTPQPMPCVEVITESGHCARLGVTHPLLRSDLTYTPCGEIKVGDWIGAARHLPEFPAASDGYSPATAELLGLLIGDGNYTRSEVQFTNTDTDVVARIESLTQAHKCILRPGSRAIGYRIVRGEAHTNHVLDLLRADGIHGQTSREKRMPDRIFRSGSEAACAILGGLFTADGHVSRKHHKALWSTSSLALARQIKHLLLRLGAPSRIEEISGSYGYGPNYRVSIGAQDQLQPLLRLLPYISARHKADDLLEAATRELKNKRNNDRIPWSQELEDAIHAARPAAANGNPNGAWPDMWSGFSADKLFRRSGCISRRLLCRLAAALKAPQLLRWTDSCVRWERVVRLRSLGELLTADAGIAEHHNFLVGDLVTHNSWALAALIADCYEQQKRILIYTKEMTADNIFWRAGACLAQVRYAELRLGKLSYDEEQSLYTTERMLHQAQLVQTVVCLSAKDTADGGDTVPWLRAKVEHYKPHIVFIDGMYLMSDAKEQKRDHERVRNISRDLRRMNLDTNIPVIATLQANRAASKNTQANLDEIAFSDAIGQDTTISMRIIKETKTPTAAIVMGGSREFNLLGFRIFCVPALNFEDYGLLDEREIEKAKDQDAPEDDAKTAKKAKAAKAAKHTTEDENLVNAMDRINKNFP